MLRQCRSALSPARLHEQWLGLRLPRLRNEYLVIPDADGRFLKGSSSKRAVSLPVPCEIAYAT